MMYVSGWARSTRADMSSGVTGIFSVRCRPVAGSVSMPTVMRYTFLPPSSERDFPYLKIGAPFGSVMSPVSSSTL